jgi:decaprenyl-phosphate phosphoribosyltransferase
LGEGEGRPPAATAREGARVTKKITAMVRLMRPMQWAKNVFVAAPLFFSKQLFEPQAIIGAIGGVVVFSLVASILYIINDWCDREADRSHPGKSMRPLASGLVRPFEAALQVGALLVCVTALLLWLSASRWLLVVLLIYVGASLSYTLGLKHVALLELFIVASGYVLRVVAGSIVVAAEPSPWILAASGLVALLITSAKRRADIAENFDRLKTRRSLEGYTVAYLDHVISMSAAMTILAYILFTVSPYAIERFHSEYLVATSVFVGYGVLRFVQLVMVGNGAEDPTRLVITDLGILTSVALWGTALFVIVYGGSVG